MAILSQPLSSSQLIKTPAEAVVKKLSVLRKKTSFNQGVLFMTIQGLTADDRLSLDRIITLIASDSLHRADYISQKKAGVGTLTV